MKAPIYLSMEFLDKYRHWLHIFTILLIILLGLSLRLYYFPTNNSWTGDIGRDYLAGHLIAFKGMNTLIGHSNSGLSSSYPPTYYYSMALYTLVGKDNHAIISVLIIISHSLVILLVYLLSKKIFSFQTGIFLALFYAVHPVFIQFSLVQITATFSILPALLAIVLLLSSFEKNKFSFLALSALFLSISISIFSGAAIVLPIFISVFLKRILDTKNTILDLIYYLASFAIFLLIQYLPVLINEIKLIHLVDIKHAFYLEPIMHSKAGLLMAYHNFKRIHPIFSQLILAMYFVFTTISLSKIKFSTLQLYLVYIITFFCQYIAIQYVPYFYEHYLVFALLQFLLFLGVFLEKIKNSKLLYFFTIILFLISTNFYSFEKYQYSPISYDMYKTIYETIQIKFPNHIILYSENCLHNESDFYNSRAFWYFQKQNDFFTFDTNDSQIEEKNVPTVYVCHIELGQERLLKSRENLAVYSAKYLEVFQIHSRYYYIYQK